MPYDARQNIMDAKARGLAEIVQNAGVSRLTLYPLFSNRSNLEFTTRPRPQFPQFPKVKCQMSNVGMRSPPSPLRGVVVSIPRHGDF